MLVKLFLYYIKSESNLGHFIGNIDIILLLIAIVSGTAVYFATDVKEYDCLTRDYSYDESRKICQVLYICESGVYFIINYVFRINHCSLIIIFFIVCID